MTYNSVFDGVADFGEKILGDSRSHVVLKKYAWQLSSICDLIGHTHTIIIDTLDRIDAAQTLEEAQQLVHELEWQPLEASFRANGLCDVFEGYGRALRRVVIPADQTNTPDDRLIAASDEQWNAMQVFLDALEEREQQVASLYTNEIREMGDFVWNASTMNDLDELKAKAAQARAVLTMQKASFLSLAAQFKQRLPG